MAQSQTTHDLNAILKRFPAFAALQKETLDRILAECSHIHVDKGDKLITRGDKADALFFVLHGRFSVDAGNGVIAEITSGEPIGELAFFSGGERTADVRAARDSKVLVLTREAYDRLAAQIPQLPDAILNSISERLSIATRQSSGLNPQAGDVVAVVPASGQIIPKEFETNLRLAFNGTPDWQVLDADSAAGQSNDIAQALRALEDNEARLILICADPVATPAWFDAITRINDALFLVGELHSEPGADVTIEAQEQTLLDASLAANTHLVLHRTARAQKIAHSARWLNPRNVGLHHHVACDCQTDFDRLSRFMRGTATGLVLCGGGAFGTAHLGAIKALQERGVTFDIVGGTSIGSAMSAVLAMEMDPSEAIDICQEIFLKKKAMKRFTFPVYGVIDHRLLDALLRTHYGAYEIEDMPVRYFAAATSLTHNDLKIMQRGPLWQAVRSSAALPGLFPPFLTSEGEVLIDGGLLDNVPITVMRGLKAGPNVIFNFNFGREWRSKADYDELPGRWGALAILLRLKRPLRPRFPSVFSVLTRAMVVGARRLMQRTDLEGDILIEIAPIKGMSFLDWRKARKQFDAAYKDMSATLDHLAITQAPNNDAERQVQMTALAQHFQPKK